jgi:hypothetical protein
MGRGLATKRRRRRKKKTVTSVALVAREALLQRRDAETAEKRGGKVDDENPWEDARLISISAPLCGLRASAFWKRARTG